MALSAAESYDLEFRLMMRQRKRHLPYFSLHILTVCGRSPVCVRLIIVRFPTVSVNIYAVLMYISRVYTEAAELCADEVCPCASPCLRPSDTVMLPHPGQNAQALRQ